MNLSDFKLDSNFDQSLRKIICLYEPLAEWFIRNQECLGYFEVTHSTSTYLLENDYVHNDLKVLGKMAIKCLEILEESLKLREGKEKSILRATKAAYAMAKIYEESKGDLTEAAKELYVINLPTLANGNEKNRVMLIRSLPKSNKNGTKNRRPGGGHRNH